MTGGTGGVSPATSYCGWSSGRSISVDIEWLDRVSVVVLEQGELRSDRERNLRRSTSPSREVWVLGDIYGLIRQLQSGDNARLGQTLTYLGWNTS